METSTTNINNNNVQFTVEIKVEPSTAFIRRKNDTRRKIQRRRNTSNVTRTTLPTDIH